MNRLWRRIQLIISLIGFGELLLRVAAFLSVALPTLIAYYTSAIHPLSSIIIALLGILCAILLLMISNYRSNYFKNEPNAKKVIGRTILKQIIQIGRLDANGRTMRFIRHANVSIFLKNVGGCIGRYL